MNDHPSYPNDPAFPLTQELRDIERTPFGLTKREYFAALAMQGLLADAGETDLDPTHYENYVARGAVKLADALIEALNQ